MNVLTIVGDRSFGPGHPRFELQASTVEKLEAVFWGRGALLAPFRVSGHFDVLTAQDPFWRGLVAWVVAWRSGARLNIQVHADLSVQSLFKRSLAEFVLRRANSVRVVSDAVKKQVEALGASAPIHVLPVFVDIDRFKNVVHQPQVQKTILWVGRFEAEKDPLYALEVFQTVRQCGIDAKLILLGKGSLEARLRERAQGLPVEFPGWQDPLQYLAQANVVLCTSPRESWGASMVEALAAGVPVVAPDVGIARKAGARVATRGELANEVMRVLQSGERGELKIEMLEAKEWSAAWRDSL